MQKLEYGTWEVKTGSQSVNDMSASSELRVFISSTFRDLQEEREHLVKKIFPEIRALCRQCGITFTEVDLRWGLTDEQAALGEQPPLEERDLERREVVGSDADLLASAGDAIICIDEDQRILVFNDEAHHAYRSVCGGGTSSSGTAGRSSSGVGYRRVDCARRCPVHDAAAVDGSGGEEAAWTPSR